MIDTCWPEPAAGRALPNESGLGIKPTGWDMASRRQVIIAIHPDEGGGVDWIPSAASAGWSSSQLADQGGYFVLAPDCGGTQNWGNPTAVTRIHDAYTYATTAIASGGLGSTSSKVGILAYSMGGLGACNFLASYSTLVCGIWMWEPVVDIRFLNQYAVSYTAPYSTTYASSQYNGYTGGTITGVNSTQSTEIAAAYPSGFSASDPMQNISSFRGLGVPIKITNASDDNGVPPGMLSYFVSQIANANVTLRSPQPLGAHNTPGPMGGSPLSSYPSTVPPSEVQAFFDSLAW